MILCRDPKQTNGGTYLSNFLSNRLIAYGVNQPKPLILMVPRGGIEPPTLRFSVACSTN